MPVVSGERDAGPGGLEDKRGAEKLSVHSLLQYTTSAV